MVTKNLRSSRATGQAHRASDDSQQRHKRAVQAYRREYDNSVPSARMRIYNGTPDGFHVPSTFLGLVQREVVDLLPFLREGQTYTVNDLLGWQFLRALNSGERRMVDKCIAILITWGMPMQVVQTPAGQTPTYKFLGLSKSDAKSHHRDDSFICQFAATLKSNSSNESSL